MRLAVSGCTSWRPCVVSTLGARCKPDELPGDVCTAASRPCGPCLAGPCRHALAMSKDTIATRSGVPASMPASLGSMLCAARVGRFKVAGIAWRQYGTQGRPGAKDRRACGAEGCRHVRRQWCPLAPAPLTAPSVMTARLRGEGASSGGSHVRTAGRISGNGAGWAALLCGQRTPACNGTTRQSNGKTHPRVRSA